MDTIKVVVKGDTIEGDVKEITRENAFDFFSMLFPRGIILTEVNGMVGLSVPREEEIDERESESE